MGARPASCMGSEQGCLMFNCLIHLWEWLDPPVVTSSPTSMDRLKGGPGAQQPLMQAQSPTMQQAQSTAGGVVHPHRRPLLEPRERRELYGATRPPPPPHLHPHHQHQHQHPRSPVHPEHQPVPPGYNVDIHNAYLRRTAERQQIYQNHCNVVYRQPEAETSYPRLTQPPSNTDLLRQQYNEIQQMKLQQQIHYQNQAQMQQQQVFAQRQLMLQQLHGLKVPSNVQTPLHHMDFGQQIQSLELHQRNFDPDYNRPRKIGAVAPLSPGPNSPEASTTGLKSPSSSEGRRSSGSSSTVLKSPVAQRLPTAPVTMSGWLYKQGSDGLKVWRKRWFVLTEYCLFYYKNHEEDKLLGSILLPSYTVSACTPDERVGKKYAFKCEHANMRTYVLAAMDQDTMNRWIRTLTMASIMQEGSASDKSGSSRTNTTPPDEVPENDHSGIGQPTYANAPPKPRRSNEGYGSPSPERYDPNYDLLRKPSSTIDHQHNNTTSPVNAQMDNIYDNKYRSKIPSSVPSNRHTNEPIYNAQNLSLLLTNTSTDRLDRPSNRHPHSFRDAQTKSPMNYDRHSQMPDEMNNEVMIDSDGIIEQQNDNQQEGLTPESYGRSPIIPGYYNSKGRMTDYEDIYNLNSKNAGNPMEMSYERPLSPNLYSERRTPMQHTSQRYTPSNAENESNGIPVDIVRRKKSPSLNNQSINVPRPHSADFLEYESANPQHNVHIRKHGSHSRRDQPPRPKSSLDINSRYDHASDNLYYSEASYAEKMRQSALYLQNKGNSVLTSKTTATPVEYQGNPFNGSYNYEGDLRSRADGRSSTDRSITDTKYTDSATNSSWSVKEKTNAVDNYNRSNSAMSEGVMSVNSAINQEVAKNELNDNFMRSASARLPTSLYDQLESADGECKVQQREESMKRLLEWKQRMLQSPLTRKSIPSSLMLSRNLNQTKLATYQQANSEHQQKYSGQTFPKATAKFASHINNSYNSFSSDDEECIASEVVSERDNGHLQAGRSHTPIHTDTAANSSSLPCSHLSDSDDTKTLLHLSHENLNSNKDTDHSEGLVDVDTDRSSGTLTKNKSVDNSTQNTQNTTEELFNSEDSDFHLEYTDNDLDEVLIESEEEGSSNDIQSGRKSVLGKKYEEKKNESDEEEPNLHGNDSEMKQRSRQATPRPETPPKKMSYEDFYLPMSPRKEVFAHEPGHKVFTEDISVFDDVSIREDNPYVEMTQGKGIENVFQSEELQTYELVCINNSHTEPVYMEVSHGDDETDKDKECTLKEKGKEKIADTKSILRRSISADPKANSKSRKQITSPIPDILMGSTTKGKFIKSDSSDADDEASKDFSMDVAYSRFSLSDTFRPASYYLGPSRLLGDLQDSSDSEIVSPPPIPLDDIDLPLSIQDYKKCMETPLMSQLIKSSEMAQAEKNGTLKKKSTSLMICGATPSMHDTIFRGERVKRNRASLPNDKKSKEDITQSYISSNSIPPLRNRLENTETESVLNYNADRNSSRMSIDSSSSNKFEIDNMDKLTVDDQQVELRHSQISFNDDIENMLKRRPLSDESFFEIQSLEGGINETIDLDQYLSELENSKVELYSNNTSLVVKCPNRDEIDLATHDDSDNSGYINERIAALRVEAHYENVKMHARSKQNASVSSNESLNINRMLRPASRMSFSSIVSDKTNRQSQARKDSSIGTSPFLYSNECHSTPQSATHSRQTSFDHSSLSFYTKNLSTETTISLEKNLNESISSDLSNKVKSFESEKVVKISPERKIDTYKSTSHSRESSTDHSAPYYYSDLSSQEHINVTPVAHFSKNTNMTRKLNNQRRKGPVSKKTEITHIHNPIHPNVASDRTQGCGEPFKIAEAARSVSAEFLSVSDKLLDIDSRNIYESSTLKRQKVRDSISSLHSNHSSKNIYPSVSHDKTSSCDATMMRHDTNDLNRLGERTQSLDGFLDHIPLTRNNITSDHNINTYMGVSSQHSITMPESHIDEQSNSSVQMPNSSITTQNDVNDSSSVYAPSDRSMVSEVCEADEQWDEDNLWRENLRRASHRHAKSMDDLDCLSLNSQRMSGRSSVDLNSMIRSSGNKTEGDKSKLNKIIRGVTYVNDNVKSQRTILNKRKLYRKSQKSCKTLVEVEKANPHDENDVYVELALGHALDTQDDGVYEQLVVEQKETPQCKYGKQKEDEKKKFEIDREKLRQWDLMSSGLMKNESCVGDSGSASVASATGGTDGSTQRQNDTNDGKPSLVDAKNEASMSTSGKGIHVLNRQSSSAAGKKPFMGSNPSLGRATRETIPVRAVSPRIRWTHQDQNGEVWNHQSNQTYPLEENWSGSRASLKQPQQPVRVVSPRVRRVTLNEDMPVSQSASNSQSADVEQLLSLQTLTAGELLGRTHEELVLLLIQLRRRHMATANSIEQTALQIHNIQDNFGVSNASERQENLQRLEILKQQLFDLEKEYQKSKPLVHLVDNMVKLGSLYNRPGHSLPSTIDRIEYNQQLRQKMILKQQEDQRRWAESLSSLSASEVQERVDELWALHRQAAGEAATLRSLQRDHLLNGGVRSGISSNPLQGISDDTLSPAGEDGGALEADLSRVHMMLAQNSKKLEQTVADNARLERELMALRQKLHKHRISETSQTNNTNNNFAANNSATALLEDEVVRVQALVSHLQSQRQLLAAALRSPQAINPQPFNFNTTPAQHNFNAPSQHNYYPHTSEMVIPSKNLPKLGISPTTLFGPNPITISIQQDIGMKKRNHSGWMETDLDSGAVVEHPEYGMTLNSTLNTPLFVETAPDDLTQQSAFGNLTNVEKQEIKTVRIVKRESERRQRERSLQPDWGIGGNPGFDQLMEEDFSLAYYGGRGSTLNRSYQSNQHIEAPKQQPEAVSALSPMEGKKFPSSPSLSTNSLNDYAVLGKSIPATKVGNGEVSPIFKSEAAREILMEISGVEEASSRRRAIPKVKRRHNTAPHHLSTHTLNQLNQEDTAFYQDKVGRSLDDADLERALRGDRPREVVRASAAPSTHFSTSTIDQLLAAPTKIFIPERYVPEQAPELSPEEERKRREKVESIRKMLSSTSNTETGKSPIDDDKKQREHLLQLNRILAKQVVEMSKIVAIKAMEKLPLDNQNCISDESSPEVELPIYQQRYNFFS